MGQHEHEEEVQQFLRQCRHGFLLKRVKKAHIESPSRVYIQDDKYFCYHSKRLWKLFPLKLNSVEIDELFEVRTGFSTDNLHYASTKPSFREAASESVCFSIIFTRPEFLHKSVDFVADSPKTCNTFFNALQYLINARKRERLFFDEKRWIAEKFREADVDKNGKLSFRELWKLLKKLNLGLSEDYARALFMDADTKKTLADRGDNLLDEEEFVNFFARLTKRADLSEIIRTYSSSHEEALTVDDLRNFLITEQQVNVSLQFPYIDDVKAQQILQTYETGKQEGQLQKLMGPIGFRQLLQSQWGSIIKPSHETVFQDMNRPLSHYFINSSHNTYITGTQVAGDATVEGYIKALNRGVRLLELDVFDGNHGLPCITHKHSLIAAITLRDALTAIDQYAFKSSPYPVILTVENHVSLSQQRIMARIFKEILGDKLYIRPVDDAGKPLPSPNALKNKFLLRGRKLSSEPSHDRVDGRNGGSEEQESDDELDAEFSRLISIPAAKLSANIYDDIRQHAIDGSPSLSESKVDAIFESLVPLCVYTATRLVKSYPSGLRQDSSNLEPMPSWLCGIQCVAMNMQTSGKSLDLNTALFRINGSCGYVLKPDILLNGFDPRSPKVMLKEPMHLSIKIISGQYLPKPSLSKGIIDPYVVVETFGISSDDHEYRSKTISNNGFNPRWDETFHFDLRCPKMAFLRICVKDSDNRPDDFIGEFSIPVTSIRPGYSHVRLNTGHAHLPDPSASLLVHTAFS